MSFLDSVVIPGKTTTAAPVNTGSFLSSVVLPPDQARANQQAQAESQAQVAKANADYAGSFSGLALNTISDIGSRVKNAGITFAHSLWDTYQQTPSKIAEDISAGAADMQTGGSPTDQANGLVKGAIKSGTRTAADAAIAVFAPISSAIGALLQATGGQTLTDKAGQVIADHTGITNLPAFQKFANEHPNAGEDFNRLLTLFMSAGEKGEINPKQITEEATTLAKKLVTPTPKAVPAAEVKGGFLETVQRPNETVPTGTGTSPVEKTSQPQVQNAQPTPPEASMPNSTENTNQPTQTATENAPLLEPIGTGEKVTSRLAANVEANAIEKKLTDGLGKLPEYNRVNFKEQAQHAADLISTDPERATRIALGQELPPNHILPEAVFTAVEDKAIKSGDVETLRKLASESTLSSQATAMGQRIRALGERDQESPVKTMQDVQKAREATVEKKTGKKLAAAKKDVVKEIKSEIQKNSSPRQSWEEFISEIKCNG